MDKRKKERNLFFGIGKECTGIPGCTRMDRCSKCKKFCYLRVCLFFLNILNSLCFCLTRQVFQCEADDCGRFYHPKCVATLLYPDSKLDASLLGDKIAARQNFTCPIHECIVCKGEGNKNDRNMQLAVCRRCPTTYHRGYLPRFSSVPLSLSCNVLLVKT